MKTYPPWYFCWQHKLSEHKTPYFEEKYTGATNGSGTACPSSVRFVVGRDWYCSVFCFLCSICESLFGFLSFSLLPLTEYLSVFSLLPLTEYLSVFDLPLWYLQPFSTSNINIQRTQLLFMVYQRFLFKNKSIFPNLSMLWYVFLIEFH